MHINEVIELFMDMPETMEGLNAEGEFVVLNTRKVAEELKKSLRNCDVGTAKKQLKRFIAFCLSRKCNECPFVSSTYGECGVRWSQMPYEGGEK